MPSTRCTTDVPTPIVRPIFTLPHALGVQLGGRRGNAANGVPGEAVNSSCNLGKADSAPPPAPRCGHARLQHRPPKFASSVTWLGESAAIWHSPPGVFFDGTVLFPAELPAIDCRPTADMASRPRSSARLPCADGVARGRSASEAKARSARPQKLKSELYQGVEANGEGVGGSNPLAQTK